MEAGFRHAEGLLRQREPVCAEGLFAAGSARHQLRQPEPGCDAVAEIAGGIVLHQPQLPVQPVSGGDGHHPHGFHHAPANPARRLSAGQRKQQRCAGGRAGRVPGRRLQPASMRPPSEHMEAHNNNRPQNTLRGGVLRAKFICLVPVTASAGHSVFPDRGRGESARTRPP